MPMPFEQEELNMSSGSGDISGGYFSGSSYSQDESPAYSSGAERMRRLVANRYSFRNWWEENIAHGSRGYKYPCYGFALATKNDPLFRYLVEKGDELHYLSGENCLIIALVGKRFRRLGFDADWRYRKGKMQYDSHLMEKAIHYGAQHGLSEMLAGFFFIESKELPGLILFREPTGVDRAWISMKGLDPEGISEKMKQMFTVLDRAAGDKKDVIQAINSWKSKEKQIDMTKKAASVAGTVISATFAEAIRIFLGGLGGPKPPSPGA